jgi:F-type H+-transporting ATPase subunit delta
MTGSLGRRYARALLSLAKETGRLDETGDELRTIATVFAEPRLATIVANPILGATGRRAIADRVLAAAKPAVNVANLVRLLAQRERLALLPEVVRAYDALLDRELGRVRVGIRTAAPLSDEMEREIVALARRLAGKDVVVSTGVAPDLVSGVVLDVGGTVYDGSVSTRLVRMSRSMAEGSR